MGMKRGYLLMLFSMLLLLVIVIPSIMADNHTEADIGNNIDIIDTGFGAEIDKAYTCLKSQLGSNCGNTASTEQNVFSLLAMGYDSAIQSDCRSELEGKKKQSCWGKTGSDSCNLKSTAQAILALDHIGKDIDDPLEWLLDKRELVDELDWFLEIDANAATSCKIKTNGAREKTFTILENKRFNPGSNNCLSVAEQGYHLKIDSDCLGDNFTISCDQDFISTLWYRKPNDLTMFISSETHAAPAEGSTEEKVNAYCFGTSSSCDYEGSLWASLVLAKIGEDTNMYVPYITAMADKSENKKYLPSAFLYMLTNEDDYYSELIDEQKQDKFWEETSDRKFYDTALALLSLQGVNIEAVDNSEEWLLGVQETSGCWHSNNLLETAFILYASWPKAPVFGIGGGDSRSYCVDFSYYCTSTGECSLANTATNYYCSGSSICCEVEPEKETCDEKDGIICDDDNTRCTGDEVTAEDTNYCCLASCEVVSENECEKAGYFCKDSCSSSQEKKSIYEGDCNFGETCCGSKGGDDDGSSWPLIITLIILIILVILAIKYREQLKIWFFRIKSKLKFGKGPKSSSRPSGRPPMLPPGAIPQFGRPRHMIPRQRTPTRRPPMRRPEGGNEGAFEDTMKKLRDMSK